MKVKQQTITWRLFRFLVRGGQGWSQNRVDKIFFWIHLYCTVYLVVRVVRGKSN